MSAASVATDPTPSPATPPPLVRRGRRAGASRKSLGARIWHARFLYLCFVPGLLFFVVFAYLPLAGNIIAWQDYSPFLGIGGSPFVAWDNFERLVTDPAIGNALTNTLIISFVQTVLGFPAPILLALLLNSIFFTFWRRLVQSIVYVPHFISWVVVVSLFQDLLSTTGPLNAMLSQIGQSPVQIYGNPDWWVALITSQVIWKNVGWGTIIFLAAMLAIPAEQYESAVIDGAGSARLMWHVTLPGIVPICALLFILTLGSVLTVGFEQILLQQPAFGADVAEVLDTFVYYRGINGGEWGFATAAGLVKGVVGTILVITANIASKRLVGSGLY